MTTAVSCGYAASAPDAGFQPGDWVWHATKGERILCCVMHVGSNYLQLDEAGPRESVNWTRSWRVHVDHLDRVSAAPDAAAWLAGKQAWAQADAQAALDALNTAMAQLGFDRGAALAGPAQGGDHANALVALNQSIDPNRYKDQLVEAKTKAIPALQSEVKSAHERMAKWLGAAALPLKARTGDMKAMIAAIDDRLFAISLYAGLIETATKIVDGAPAPAHEKLRVMQRRLYMDEECLLQYEAGGMEFKDVEDFDAWLARPENRDRLLPHPRCLVAFRVRRNGKDRAGEMEAFIRLHLDWLDKATFFYARNGDQIWRIQTEIEFPDQIVPDKSFYDPSQPMMGFWSFNRIDDIVPKSAYDDALERLETARAQDQANGKIGVFRTDVRLGKDYSFTPANWHPVSPSSVYFDDAMETLGAEAKTYNRIAVLIQGMLDRSEIFHPHPRIQVWNPAHFEQFIELVYDASTALYEGDRPDFEAYRARLNASIDETSFLVGQDDVWSIDEARKENERRDEEARRSRTGYGREHVNRFRPYENMDPGPGLVVQPARWTRSTRTATFRWQARRANASSWKDDGKRVTREIKVPADRLLNVSAYRAGDFKQFFRDPRTRADYLEWAPLLLAAEDFVAKQGNAQ